MVFGTTYCAISHLPIEDGDKCILMPLGFSMKYNFDQYNKADVNSFMYIYSFIYEPQQVIYNGNPDDIKYLNDNYHLKHELFMLVHLDFYNSIQKEYMKDAFSSISDLHLFKTCEDIWIKAKEIEKEYRDKEMAKLTEKKLNGKKPTKKEINNLFNVPVPKWMIEVYKVAMFMDGIGMIPYPNHVVDQHQRNKLYEKLRSDCLKNKNKKK